MLCEHGVQREEPQSAWEDGGVPECWPGHGQMTSLASWGWLSSGRVGHSRGYGKRWNEMDRHSGIAAF